MQVTNCKVCRNKCNFCNQLLVVFITFKPSSHCKSSSGVSGTLNLHPGLYFGVPLLSFVLPATFWEERRYPNSHGLSLSITLATWKHLRACSKHGLLPTISETAGQSQHQYWFVPFGKEFFLTYLDEISRIWDFLFHSLIKRNWVLLIQKNRFKIDIWA